MRSARPYCASSGGRCAATARVPLGQAADLLSLQDAAAAFLRVTQLDNQVASAFLNLGLALGHMPGYDGKSAEAKGIAARLNPDFADMEPETGAGLPPTAYGLCFLPFSRTGG